MPLFDPTNPPATAQGDWPKISEGAQKSFEAWKGNPQDEKAREAFIENAGMLYLATTAEREHQAKEAEKNKPPEKYALKLPEGSRVHKAWMQKTEAYAKENKLSQAQADAILKRDHEFLEDFIADNAAALEAEDKANEEAVVKALANGDKAKLPEINATLDVVLNKYDTKGALRKFLKEQHLTNRPELVEVFHSIGAAMKADEQLVDGKRKPEEKKEVRVADKFATWKQPAPTPANA
jgi:hypothetical protein